MAMSNTVGSQVQVLAFARQADPGWLDRLDGCQYETTHYHSEYGLW